MFGNLRPFPNKNVPIWDHFLPLLFPKDSESLKILDIQLWKVGTKRRLNVTLKVNTQTDILTYRKHRPRGPMFWKVLSTYDQRYNSNNQILAIFTNYSNKALLALYLLIIPMNMVHFLFWYFKHIYVHALQLITKYKHTIRPLNWEKNYSRNFYFYIIESYSTKSLLQ